MELSFTLEVLSVSGLFRFFSGEGGVYMYSLHCSSYIDEWYLIRIANIIVFVWGDFVIAS